MEPSGWFRVLPVIVFGMFSAHYKREAVRYISTIVLIVSVLGSVTNESGVGASAGPAPSLEI